MSIVGPRPIIFDELKLYKENKELLLNVRPGLTGYWASHGRSDTTYEESIKMELYYVKNVSFFLERHPQFQLEFQKQILPVKGKQDGFFIAKLKRNSYE